MTVQAELKAHTKYLWFDTKKRREYIRITDEVAKFLQETGMQEGFILVSAMHITAGVYINDWEGGLIQDIDAGKTSSRQRTLPICIIAPGKTMETLT